MSIQIGEGKYLDMADRSGTDILYCAKCHTVVDDIHDPHSKTGHDDHHKNSGKIIPHHLEVYRMFCDDLVDCIAEQYRDIQLKDHGNRSQDDA